MRFLMLTASGLHIDDLKTDGPRETTDDLILNLKNVRLRGVEAISPYLVSCLGIYEMGINTHTWTLGQHTSFEHIAHVKRLAELACIQGLPFESERRLSCDNKTAWERPRKVRRQAIGDPVGEVILRRISAKVGKWQGDY